MHCVLSACVSVHHMYAWYLASSKGSPGMEATDGYKLKQGCWELNPGPLSPQRTKISCCPELAVTFNPGGTKPLGLGHGGQPGVHFPLEVLANISGSSLSPYIIFCFLFCQQKQFLLLALCSSHLPSLGPFQDYHCCHCYHLFVVPIVSSSQQGKHCS